MFFRYTKRRSTTYINLNNIESVSLYDIDIDHEGNKKELAITLVSGQKIVEKRKAIEVYEKLRHALEVNLYTNHVSQNY